MKRIHPANGKERGAIDALPLSMELFVLELSVPALGQCTHLHVSIDCHANYTKMTFDSSSCLNGKRQHEELGFQTRMQTAPFPGKLHPCLPTVLRILGRWMLSLTPSAIGPGAVQ